MLKIVTWFKANWAMNIDCKDEEEQARIEKLRENFIAKLLFDTANNGLRLFTAFFVAVQIGAVALMFTEGARYVDSLYWSMVTVFTVGYGDISPQTDPGKWLVILYLPVSAILLSLLITYIVQLAQYHKDRNTHREQELQELHVQRAEAKADLLLEVLSGLFPADASAEDKESRILELIQRNKAECCIIIDAQDAENAEKAKALAGSKA